MHAAIRMANDQDAEQICAIYAPFVRDSYITFETEPPDAREMKDRIRKVTERWPWLVWEQASEVLGYVYASEHHSRAAYQWSTDVTVYVRTNQHRKGIGRALYATLFSLLRLQGYRNAIALIALPNAPSVALHETMGFQQVGLLKNIGYRLGAWRDVGYWQLPLQVGGDVPSQPLARAEAEGHPEWKAAIGAAQVFLRV